jgi:PAS domain S-box-containing protein
LLRHEDGQSSADPVSADHRAFADIFGYAPEELAGQSIERLYPSYDEFVRIGARGWPIMRATGCYSDERIMMRCDGTMFWCRVSGRSLVREEPFAYAVWVFEDLSKVRPIDVKLTSREREVAALVVAGKTSKQIARALGVSPRTVETYRARLLRKLEVSTPTELVARILGLPQ